LLEKVALLKRERLLKEKRSDGFHNKSIMELMEVDMFRLFKCIGKFIYRLVLGLYRFVSMLFYSTFKGVFRNRLQIELDNRITTISEGKISSFDSLVLLRDILEDYNLTPEALRVILSKYIKSIKREAEHKMLTVEAVTEISILRNRKLNTIKRNKEKEKFFYSILRDINAYERIITRKFPMGEKLSELENSLIDKINTLYYGINGD